MSRSYDAVVIGAGPNALVAAAYLGRAGLSTLVTEQRDRVGGGTSSEELFPGFTFDTGAHRGARLNPAIVRDLGLAAHGLQLLRSDPSLFVPTTAGRHLLLGPSNSVSAESIRSFSDADAERWTEFTGFTKMVSGFLSSLFSIEPPDLPDPSRPDMRMLARLGIGLRKLGRSEMESVVRVLPMSCLEFLDEWFESEPLRGALAGVSVQGGAHGPMATGTAFNLFRRAAESGSGNPIALVRPRGGMGRLAEALASAARAAGVEIRTDAVVESVRLREGRVAGVVLKDGTEISARTVASGAGPGVTLLGLSDPAALSPEFVRALKAVRYRGATAKVHLALGELPRFDGMPDEGPHLGGAISISPSLEYVERASDAAKYGRVSEAPYLEAVIPSVAQPDLAPQGKHGMSVLAQYAPYHLRDGWAPDSADALADAVIETLGRYAPNLPGAVEDRHVLTPAGMEEKWSLQEGSIFQGEMTLDQFFFARPVAGWARYRTPIEGLYLCGAGTHPGGGPTGGSGYLAARRILRDARDRR